MFLISWRRATSTFFLSDHSETEPKPDLTGNLLSTGQCSSASKATSIIWVVLSQAGINGWSLMLDTCCTASYCEPRILGKKAERFLYPMWSRIDHLVYQVSPWRNSSPQAHLNIPWNADSEGTFPSAPAYYGLPVTLCGKGSISIAQMLPQKFTEKKIYHPKNKNFPGDREL